MMVQHPDAFTCEAIDIRGLDLGAIAANVGVALDMGSRVSFSRLIYPGGTHKVISQDDEKVGTPRGPM